MPDVYAVVYDLTGQVIYWHDTNDIDPGEVADGYSVQPLSRAPHTITMVRPSGALLTWPIDRYTGSAAPDDLAQWPSTDLRDQISAAIFTVAQGEVHDSPLVHAVYTGIGDVLFSIFGADYPVPMGVDGSDLQSAIVAAVLNRYIGVDSAGLLTLVEQALTDAGFGS